MSRFNPKADDGHLINRSIGRIIMLVVDHVVEVSEAKCMGCMAYDRVCPTAAIVTVGKLARRLQNGFPSAHDQRRPKIMIFPVTISVGQSTPVKPVATAIFCAPFAVYVMTPPPIPPPIFCPHSRSPVLVLTA